MWLDPAQPPNSFTFMTAPRHVVAPRRLDRTSDRDVFEFLYQRRHDQVLSSLTGRLRDRDRAADITAAPVATAWEKWDPFRRESSARHVAPRDWCEHRTEELAAGADRPSRALVLHRDPQGEPDRLSARVDEELLGRLWNTPNRIPAKRQRLPVDHDLNELSMQQLARRAECPSEP
jgi:hypothetical protein